MAELSPSLFITLYTDEDVTKLLAPALRQRGYQAQSMLEANNLANSDEEQLTYAAENNMAILTYNGQDFIPLAETWYHAGKTHAGIIIAPQFSERQFGDLLRQTLRLLDQFTSDELSNQVLFLQQFKY